MRVLECCKTQGWKRL